MNRGSEYLTSKPFLFSEELESCGLLILASGFEARDKHFISKISLRRSTRVIVVNFKSKLKENDDSKVEFHEIINSFKLEFQVFHVDLDTSAAHLFDTSFSARLSEVPLFEGDIYVDISGVPAHAICTILANVRELFPTKVVAIIYTSAKDYIPTHQEYLELVSNSSSATGEIEYVPRTMALEMSDNLIPGRFSGHRSAHSTTTLLLFAGYEVHRSSGVIEAINPSRLVLIYGVPGEEGLCWRNDLSQRLHKRFESSRSCAIEHVSTLHVSESLNLLEEYYLYMFDDHDFSISPVCSKMQTVAVYLFWEKYREVQLVFPLPIGYDPKQAPLGVGCTYVSYLPPKSSLHRGTRWISANPR